VSWTSLRVEPGERRAEAMAALFAEGAQGVHEDGPALVTHFPPGADVARVVAALETAVPGVTYEIGSTETTDWSVAWRDRITAQALGRIVVTPPWLASEFDSSRTVVIDPGMAFGTGDHASTRGCIRLLQNEVQPGCVVADLGAGSAVLSIVAAKLGASRVFAIEYDGDAIANAEANIRANDAESVVHLFEGDAGIFLPLIAPLDLIAANIISSVIVELLPAMRASLRERGRAVLAGILFDERDTMLEAFAGGRWNVISEDTEDAWWSVTIEKQ
jgi:ribosomal protein L11 methyltransferase